MDQPNDNEQQPIQSQQGQQTPHHSSDLSAAQELSAIEKSFKPHGRRNVAKAILKECLEQAYDQTTIYAKPPFLRKILDLLLDPRHTPDAFVEWIPTLLAGGRDQQDFWNILKEYSAERHCGLAWPTNYVAYRCRTCSYSSSMSLCADCFRNGDHEGHDYNMFKSRSGGACDCGYSIVDESGHCKNHGINANAKRDGEVIPYELICVAKKSMPAIIHRLVIQLRKGIKEVIQEIDGYLDFLHKLSSRGEVIRKVMIETLTNKSLYASQLNEFETHPKKDISDLFKDRLTRYAIERKNLIPVRPQRIDAGNLENLEAFNDVLQHTCFIEELLFWVVVYEFPQKLVCLLLGFLMDSGYKQTFAITFVNLCPRIVTMLTNLNDHSQRLPRDTFDQLTRRVLLISVQIYNDKDLSEMLCEDCHALHILIYSLMAVIGGVKGSSSFNSRRILKANLLAKTIRVAPLVVSCEDLIIRDRHFSSFTEDLNNLLPFYSVAMKLLEDDHLLEIWIEMASFFQTMSPNRRELTDYTLYENNTYSTIFTIESEFCLTPLWSLLSHLKDSSTAHLTTKLSEALVGALSRWFRKMGRVVFREPNVYLVSFHLPLHRMFVATIRNALFVQNVPSILPTECYPNNSMISKCKDFFISLMMNPLQAIVLYHEIRCNLWTRNGMQIVSQAMTYIHCSYCNSTIDLDMFALRLCASYLEPNYFVRTVFERFHIWEWFSLECKSVEQFKPSDGFRISNEQVVPMIENSLAFLIQLLTLQMDCDVSDRARIRKEMVALISVSDPSYSHLVNMLPAVGGMPMFKNDNVFETLLEDMTRYTPPTHDTGGNLRQGTYTLQEHVWDDEYDPAHVMYRVYHRRDYQMSLERFFQHCKRTGKIDKNSQSTSLWPPFRIPPSLCVSKCINLRPILRSNTLLGTIYNILYKSVYMTDVTDNLVAYAVHLLYLACRVSIDDKFSNQESQIDTSVDDAANEQNQTTMKKHSSRTFISTLEYHEITQVEVNSQNMEHILGHRLCIKSPLKRYNQRNSNLSASDEKLPTVRSAIDLNFDTWFPFENVLDNLIVMIEDEVLHLSLVEQENQVKAKPKELPMISLEALLAGESTGSTVGLITDGSSESDEEIECVINHGQLDNVQSTSIDMESATVEEMPDNLDSTEAHIETIRSIVTILDNSATGTHVTNQDGQSQTDSYHTNHNNCTTESILTLLLRFHSQITQQANSYNFNHDRASSILKDERQSHQLIGGGDVFVGRILDLVCLHRSDFRKKAEIMSSLIWNQESESCPRQSSHHYESQNRAIKADVSGSKNISVTANSPTGQSPSQVGSTPGAASQKEALSKQDRRRKAKKYQNKLMAEFALKQRAFLKKYDPKNDGGLIPASSSGIRDKLGNEPDLMEQQQDKPFCRERSSRSSPRKTLVTYECCICGNDGPSEPNNPFGQVVLLQSTSVLGHAHVRSQEERQLPCEEFHCKGLKEETFAKFTERRIDTLCEHFVENSWLDSLNIGVNGGVHIQSCGHYLHIKCHQAYIRSMDTQEDRRSRNFDPGEFACPVCRQLANSVLPIVFSYTPTVEDQAIVAHSDLSAICCQIANLLANKLTPNQDEFKPSAAFCSDLTNATGPQYRSVRTNPSMHSLFLFLASIARTNLETEVVVNLSNALPCGSKKPCFVPLFHFLALNARTLISDHWYATHQVWSHLTNYTPDSDVMNIKPIYSEVPLLLKDPVALVIQLLFAISPAIVDQSYFLCIIQVLFNLCATQSMCLLLAYMRPDCRPTIIFPSDADQINMEDEPFALDIEVSAVDVRNSLVHLLALVNNEIYDCLIDSEAPTNFGVHDWIIGADSGDKKSPKKNLTSEDVKCIETKLKLICLPFLRVAALLQHHLYKEPFPYLSTANDSSDPSAIDSEFVNLVGCLKLGQGSNTPDADEVMNATNFLDCLSWPTEDPSMLIKSWSYEFTRFSSDYIVTARTLLLRRPLMWHRPSLMRLPYNFNDIFMFYYRKKCSLCLQVPKDVAICLVCGAPVCFRVSCCKDKPQRRQVAAEHSQLCGANTALFLAVHSSSIIVIRGNRACIWGSVYLDSHGEEDNGLKRGKPLFLVQERYDLLEQQWLTHSFDHTRGKRWIFLQEAH